MANSPGDVADKLNQLASNLSSEFEGTRNIPVRSLFPESFMTTHTRWESIDAMMAEAGIEDVNGFTSEKWHAFVASGTDFVDWKSMMLEAYKMRVQDVVEKTLS